MSTYEWERQRPWFITAQGEQALAQHQAKSTKQ